MRPSRSTTIIEWTNLKRATSASNRSCTLARSIVA
jgi:hypothetical protein